MIEIPEAANLAQEMRTSLVGRRIVRAAAAASPHRFAFYYGNPAQYAPQLEGRRIDGASSFGGFAQLHIGQTRLAVSDGANLRLYGPGEKHPAKHQLYIELDDGCSLLCTIQMYGGIWVFPEGGMRDNEYLQGARAKPSPLSDAFDEAYFDSLRRGVSKPSISVKAFLATEQRIPGLGNGVLQDILFMAGVNPKTKLGLLTDGELKGLYHSVKDTLRAMTDEGGRSTERDLFGRPRRYPTMLSSKTYQLPCPHCGGGLVRQAYLGGNIYYCPKCQPVKQ